LGEGTRPTQGSFGSPVKGFPLSRKRGRVEGWPPGAKKRRRKCPCHSPTGKKKTGTKKDQVQGTKMFADNQGIEGEKGKKPDSSGSGSFPPEKMVCGGRSKGGGGSARRKVKVSRREKKRRGRVQGRMIAGGKRRGPRKNHILVGWKKQRSRARDWFGKGGCGLSWQKKGVEVHETSDFASTGARRKEKRKPSDPITIFEGGKKKKENPRKKGGGPWAPWEGRTDPKTRSGDFIFHKAERKKTDHRPK